MSCPLGFSKRIGRGSESDDGACFSSMQKMGLKINAERNKVSLLGGEERLVLR